MKIKLTKIDVDRWTSGPYSVRRQEFGDVLRYIVTGPGVSSRASHGCGNDMTTLADVREVIAEAIGRPCAVCHESPCRGLMRCPAH